MGNSLSNRKHLSNGYRLPSAIQSVAKFAALGIACDPGQTERPSASALDLVPVQIPIPSDSDESASQGHPKFALTIGINTYQSEKCKLENLRGAVNDADNFDEYLCKDLGIPEENIISLRNTQATRSAIIDGFRRLKNDERITPDKAAIIIYYAGHGAMANKPVGWSDWQTPEDKIEILCPSDMGLPDENNEDALVDGIPDRTISRLLLDLSKAKGNNITLILDCCHAAGINRGGGENTAANGQTQAGLTRPRTLPDVQDLSPTCDEDIYSGELSQSVVTSGFSGSLWDSHVLLAACGRRQSAEEMVDGTGGIFTKALLKGLRCESFGFLTYASLIDRLDMSEIYANNQTPYLDGKHTNRYLFDSAESPADRSMILCHREEDCLVLHAGSLHGIIKDSTFAIHGIRDLSDPHHQGTTAVANCVEKFVSYLQPSDIAFFTAYKGHHVWYARLTKASGPSLVIHCNIADDLNRILTEDCEPRLTVPTNPTTNQCEADLCLTVEGSTIFFDRGVKNSVLSVCKDFPSRFPVSLKVNDTAGIRRVINHYGCFHSHLNMPSARPFSDYISIEMHELKDGLSPTGDDLLPDGEEKPAEFVVGCSSRVYGFTIRNLKSDIDLYAYLFYFDAPTLKIDAWYSAPRQGYSQKQGVVDTGLQKGSKLTLGYGSGGMNSLKFTVPPGQDVDVCFFKLFVTTEAVDLGCISQSSPFTQLIGRGCELVEPPAQKNWVSRTIPVVTRRAQTAQSPSLQPGSSSEPTEE